MLAIGVSRKPMCTRTEHLSRISGSHDLSRVHTLTRVMGFPSPCMSTEHGLVDRFRYAMCRVEEWSQWKQRLCLEHGTSLPVITTGTQIAVQGAVRLGFREHVISAILVAKIVWVAECVVLWQGLPDRITHRVSGSMVSDARGPCRIGSYKGEDELCKHMYFCALPYFVLGPSQ